MDKVQPGMVPLSSVLRQIAKELSGVDHQINAMELVLQQEVIGRALSVQQIEDLQGVDHARQILICLEKFLQDLSDGAVGAIAIDPKPVVKDITLNGLAHRLTHPEAKPEVSNGAHVHFF